MTNGMYFFPQFSLLPGLVQSTPNDTVKLTEDENACHMYSKFLPVHELSSELLQPVFIRS